MDKQSMILQITALVRAGKLNGKTYEVPYGGMRFLLHDFNPFGCDDFLVSRRLFNDLHNTWESYDRPNGHLFVDEYLDKIFKAVTSDVFIDKNLFK